jgi:hypothetical protein
MRCRVALFTLALIAAAASGAAADTIVAGGNVINQTWTPAGSPYIVQGDVTVPVGAFLTVDAGTTIQFASTDGQAAGLDTNRVELISARHARRSTAPQVAAGDDDRRVRRARARGTAWSSMRSRRRRDAGRV